MTKRNAVFPSRFLTAGDLNGKPVTLTIERAPLETLKNRQGEEVKRCCTSRAPKKLCR